MFGNDFFDILSEMFGTTSYRFQRPTLDQKPYKAYSTENGMILVVNTLGISKSDINVEMSRPLANGFRKINVSGKTKIPTINEENKIDLSIILKFQVEIQKINYEVKDGFTYIYIKVVDPEAPADDEFTKVNPLSDGEELDF